MKARTALPAVSLTIGRLAERAGVGIDTVRFYERAGLLPLAARSGGGYRLYGEDDIARLRFIRRAKALGFSLEDIAELLTLSAGGSRAPIKQLAERRLADLDARIAELGRMRAALAQSAQQCSGHGSAAGCPIIESLNAPQAQDAAA